MWIMILFQVFFGKQSDFFEKHLQSGLKGGISFCMTKKEHILVIKLGALGDVVLALGHMRTIRERHPEAHITLMTGGAFVKLCKQTGYFDDFVVDNRLRYNVPAWYRICKKTLADKPYDVIYDLQRSKRTLRKYYPIARFLTKHSMTWAALSKVESGFDVYKTPAKKRFWNRAPETSFLPMTFYKPDLSFCKGEEKYFHELPEKYVLLIPGCSAAHPYKRWPAQSFRAVSVWLGEHGIKSVVLGTNDEKEVIETITNDNPHAISFLNKTGLLDIPELARRALTVISNDTGPMHFSAFTGTPLIALFCERTRKSAPRVNTAVVFVEQDIKDIAPGRVINQLKKNIPELAD